MVHNDGEMTDKFTLMEVVLQACLEELYQIKLGMNKHKIKSSNVMYRSNKEKSHVCVDSMRLSKDLQLCTHALCLPFRLRVVNKTLLTSLAYLYANGRGIIESIIIYIPDEDL